MTFFVALYSLVAVNDWIFINIQVGFALCFMTFILLSLSYKTSFLPVPGRMCKHTYNETFISCLIISSHFFIPYILVVLKYMTNNYKMFTKMINLFYF